jgi:hypothetical protein
MIATIDGHRVHLHDGMRIRAYLKLLRSGLPAFMARCLNRWSSIRNTF